MSRRFLRLAAAAMVVLWGVSRPQAAEPQTPVESGFTPLFDGRSLAGWVTAPGAYTVENGAIVCVAGSKGNLLTEREYANFILRFEFRLTPGANNGLGVRCPLKTEGNLHLEGIELQIIDGTHEKFKTIKDYQQHGSVYGIVPAKREGMLPVGQWNRQEVTVDGRRIRVVLNGVTIVDADLDKASPPKTLDGAEHPGLRRPTGHLGFLGHGDRIEVRHVRIRELPAK